MASEQAILNMMGRALWDPNPTAGSDLRSRQLATALGYPKTWRVVRTIENAPPIPIPIPHPRNVLQQQQQQQQQQQDNNTKMEINEATTTLEENAVADMTTTTTIATTTTATTNDKDTPPLESNEKAATATATTTTTESKVDDKTQTKEATSKEDDVSKKDPTTIISSANNDMDSGKKEDDKMEIDQETTTTTTAAAAAAAVEPVISETGNEPPITTTTNDKVETCQEAVAAENIDASGNDAGNTAHAMDTEKDGNVEQTEKESKKEAKISNDDDDKKISASTTTSAMKRPATTLAGTDNEKPPAANAICTTDGQPQPMTAATTKTKKAAAKVIVDRIYAGKPGTDCDMWFNHYAAMQAAQEWDEIVNNGNNTNENGEASSSSPTTTTLPSPFHFKGGHLLPRMSKFEKNDKVEVLFENKWWEAKILRKKEHVDGFRYQVHYNVDSSKQSGIDESLIRHRSAEKDPHHVATLLGFDAGWQAVSTGYNRWKITSPSGVTYQSKKAALMAIKDEVIKATEVGDPPWRTSGHDYIGRFVLYTQQHAVSARRKITVEQTGKVTGWISATDVDKAGEPGFISETTGKPANLFHIEFDDVNPQHHPYPTYLVQSQDLEEFEVEACLIPEQQEKEEQDVGSPAKKKARTKR